MFPSYRNQLVDLQSKLIDLFLYDGNNVRERVELKSTSLSFIRDLLTNAFVKSVRQCIKMVEENGIRNLIFESTAIRFLDFCGNKFLNFVSFRCEGFEKINILPYFSTSKFSQLDFDGISLECNLSFFLKRSST